MPRCRLLVTNSLTAELVKTLENAWRDVRLAFLAEVVRYCDRADIDFFTLRALPAQASAH
jgi:UDP-N-acetyl-D-mannosaminuronate dehydrogenase